jgi:hypothetical protein
MPFAWRYCGDVQSNGFDSHHERRLRENRQLTDLELIRLGQGSVGSWRIRSTLPVS